MVYVDITTILITYILGVTCRVMSMVKNNALKKPPQLKQRLNKPTHALTHTHSLTPTPIHTHHTNTSHLPSFIHIYISTQTYMYATVQTL